MDWIFLFYALLALTVLFGVRISGRGEWNEESTSLRQTRVLQGIMALAVVLHHLAQKTCAPWNPAGTVRHGLDPFLQVGYLFVGVFLFCSGFGLYKSLRLKENYLKGFFRRRVIPVVVAFCLSEFLYTAVRLLMGQRMDFRTVLWYLSGLHMANPDSWYVIAVPFFYLVYWAAFRFCRREGTAILWVFLFSLAYTVSGAVIGRQSDWWMQGEWWYNSILLFPLGLLFGKYEQQAAGCVRKRYGRWLAGSFVSVFLLFFLSEYLNSTAWGYFRTVPHRLLSAGLQWLVCAAFAAFWFLLLMKVRLGNRVLSWLGGLTLDLYLIHPVFVELFGFNFLNMSRSLLYIRNVALYSAAVLAASLPAACLFRLLRLRLTGLLTGTARKKAEEDPEKNTAEYRIRMKMKRENAAWRKIGRWVFPALLVLTVGAYVLLSLRQPVLTVGGVVITPPEGYTQRHRDSRYTVWEYTGTDKKPGRLVLDVEIRGDTAQHFATAEEVLADCGWLQDAELYVNPRGIRMARGYTTEASSEYPQRRYYVETRSAVFLICMIEDSRYYSTEDCEEAILQMADNCHY